MKTTARMFSLTLAIVIALAGLVTAAPNLSGTWVLDRSQSEFPGHGKSGRGPHGRGADAGDPPQMKLVVQHQGDTLRVTRALTRGERERTMTETLNTTGAEQSQQAGRGTVVSKAAWNGDRLVVTETTSVPGRDGGEPRQMTRESVWTVSPDGRTLTIETKFSTPRGERQMKTVYQKS